MFYLRRMARTIMTKRAQANTAPTVIAAITPGDRGDTAEVALVLLLVTGELCSGITSPLMMENVDVHSLYEDVLAPSLAYITGEVWRVIAFEENVGGSCDPLGGDIIARLVLSELLVSGVVEGFGDTEGAESCTTV